MEDKAADETDTNWRGNYSDDKTEKLTGRDGSGSTRLRVNRLFFAVFFKFSMCSNKTNFVKRASSTAVI